MLLWCSINTQSFIHVKSSSIPQFISGKARILQKLLRYLSGIVTSTIKVGTAGCGGQLASLGFPDFAGLSGIFSTIVVLYLKHLPSEALLLILLILSL